MSDFFSHWWHHSGNFPSGLSFGLPLFVWNRIAKLFLFGSALVILMEIVGADRVEHGFRDGRERLQRVNTRYDVLRGRIINGLTHWIAILASLFRSLVSRSQSSAELLAGRKSLSLGIVCLVLLGLAAFLSCIFVLLPWLLLDVPLVLKLSLGLAFTLLEFLTLWLGSMLLLLAVTVTLWLVSVVVLRVPLLVVTCLLRATGRIHNKGVIHSWRMASAGFLFLGFVLDLLSS